MMANKIPLGNSRLLVIRERERERVYQFDDSDELDTDSDWQNFVEFEFASQLKDVLTLFRTHLAAIAEKSLSKEEFIAKFDEQASRFLETHSSFVSRRHADEMTPEMEHMFEEVPIDEEALSSALEFNSERVEKIGLQIRNAMAQQNLNQSDLAKLVGVSPAAISKILNNLEKAKISTLANLARALGVDVSTFFAQAT